MKSSNNSNCIETGYCLGSIDQDGHSLKLSDWVEYENEPTESLSFQCADADCDITYIEDGEIFDASQFLTKIKAILPVNISIYVNGIFIEDLARKAHLLGHACVCKYTMKLSIQSLSDNDVSNFLKEEEMKKYMTNKISQLSMTECQKMMKRMPHVFNG